MWASAPTDMLLVGVKIKQAADPSGPAACFLERGEKNTLYENNLQSAAENVNGWDAGFIICLQEWGKIPIAYSKIAW